jgi:catechol 2,3-dioxygenase-like lactoylglutathione lyase family enzyme
MPSQLTMDIFEQQGHVRAIYHVSLGVSDIENARSFYHAALHPLGYRLLWEVKEQSGITSLLRSVRLRSGWQPFGSHVVRPRASVG